MPEINYEKLERITKLMWNNYGKIFAEYMFIKNFRKGNLSSKIIIEGQEILEEIKKNKKQVVFISGHLSNFELMALHLEKSGINLAKFIPDFSKCKAISSKLLRCPEIKTTCFLFFFISSRISCPSIIILDERLPFLKFLINIYSAKILP